MYKRDAKSWLKHLDFMILDIVILQLSFILSYILRHGLKNPYATPLYANMALFLFLCDLVIIFFTEPFRNILKRGYYVEFESIFQQTLFLVLFAALYLFAQKTGEAYSRITLFTMAPLYALLSYGTRLAWKTFLKKNRRDGDRSLLIITTAEKAADTIASIRTHNYRIYRFAGLVLMDGDYIGTEIGSVPVVASADTMAAYTQKAWIDEVFFNLPQTIAVPHTLINDLISMGITVHMSLDPFSYAPGKAQVVEKVGNFTVLTTSMKFATTKQAFLKRTTDIIGSIIGCLITLVLLPFVAAAIYISSPGPVFFVQERIGKNGKRFKMYKFRSMYLDAEARKQEYLHQNKLSSDLMFKMDFDPRIIGNRILPDGTKKTGIGHFLRTTSIDEFPQFFNVLKGDMSLVGTRPPLVSEFDKYAPHHRARMSVKPGITGLWQISGRSEITDFEEVVRLDTQYIMEWSMGLDFRILIKTIAAVIKQTGSL